MLVSTILFNISVQLIVLLIPTITSYQTHIVSSNTWKHYVQIPLYSIQLTRQKIE